MAYGFKDIKTKLPLLLLPLFFTGDDTFHLRKRFAFVQWVFLSSLVVCTLLSFGVYFRWIKPQQFEPLDMRTMVFGVSGVRLALFLCLGICWLAYSMWKEKSMLHRLGFVALAAWFLFFLNFIESGTGMVFLFILLVFSVIYLINKYFSGFKRWLIYIPFMLLAVYGLYLVYNTARDMLVLKPDPVTATQSKLGEKYIMVDHLDFVENGYVVGASTAPLELEKAWNERSAIPYYGRDKRGQQMYCTVIRYLNSMGKAKDREALMQLTDNDIRNIENGVANHLYLSVSGWKRRLMQIIFELEAYSASTLNPFGNSITQRFEYWKIAGGIIVQNPWIGVGTGDVRLAFDEVYSKYPFPIDESFRLRAHNQYLTMGVSFGLVGIIVFLLYATALWWTGRYRQKAYLALSFLLIMLLSFVSEDTLETQSGVTFIAFFHTFFALGKADPGDRLTGENLGHEAI